MAMNASSSESENFHQDVSRLVDSLPASSGIADDHVNVVVAESSVSKRKGEVDFENSEMRSQKLRRSDANDNGDSESGVKKGGIDPEEERKARNRENAKLSRQRSKHRVEVLEYQNRTLKAQVTHLEAANMILKRQLSVAGICPVPPPQPPTVLPPPSPPPPLRRHRPQPPPPPPQPPIPQGLYPHAPMAPMPYLGVPYAPYPVEPRRSQIPLVPIPRIKPQQPFCATKEEKKSEAKSRKVPGVSFLGLLFFIFILSGIRMVSYRSVEDTDFSGFYQSHTGFHDPRAARVLLRSYHSHKDFDSERGRFAEADSKDENKQGSRPFAGSDEFFRKDNSSDPFVAPLYVLINNKLVEIYGNFIIDSVLASEKAMASDAASKAKNGGEEGLPSNVAPGLKKTGDNSLAIPGNLPPALESQVRQDQNRHSRVHGNWMEQQIALTSGARDTLKSTTD